MKKNKLRIYIHIPFCIKKCNYCNFVSTVLKDKHKLGKYITYLDKELNLYKDHIELKPLTIYIGGGTPSLFSPYEIYRLGDLFSKYINKAFTTEFTIEANPESITQEKILAWKDIGINRVSLGVQSFDDNILLFLGRPHKVKDTIKAITILKNTFDNISFDLIYGISGQDMDTWKRTLKKALEFEPQHISMYGLSIEEGTLFYRWRKENKLTLPDDALTVDMYNFG
jgi:oxygen-independent coproporphyrinogen-3 oxidase